VAPQSAGNGGWKVAATGTGISLEQCGEYNPSVPVEYLYDERVALSPIEDDDVPAMQRWVSDQGVIHFLGFNSGMSVAQEQSWLDSLRKNSSECVFAIRLRDGRYIGNTGLHGISSRDRHAEFGIFIGERDCWAQGYGTEAARLMLDHGFNRLNLHRIQLRHIDYNERGRASYLKLGFTEEGRLRQDHWREDGWHDTLMMGLLRDEFNTQWTDWRKAQRERYGIPQLDDSARN
jgi:RimJ/RimL family protein N-acetyltransferase